MSVKRTPIYNKYARTAPSVKLMEFGGWEMPLQFSSIVSEHMAVRTGVGLFDVSHMGEIRVSGANACDMLNYVLTNDLRKLKTGRTMYSLMCNENGGVVDDVLVYMQAVNDYLVVVNAGNIQKDYEHISGLISGSSAVENVSDSYCQLALQGPCSLEVLAKLVKEDFDLHSLKYFAFANDVNVGGVRSLVSRTGYTGEDGFEIYCPAEYGVRLWDLILEAGQANGIMPIGLGARDTLRLEAGLPLYGHELSDVMSPLAANLGRFIKTDKSDFVGKAAILANKDEIEKSRKLTGIVLSTRAVPRPDYLIYSADSDADEIGYVTSGIYSPIVKSGIALCYIDNEYAKSIGTQVYIDIRGKKYSADIVKYPFVHR